MPPARGRSVWESVTHELRVIVSGEWFRLIGRFGGVKKPIDVKLPKCVSVEDVLRKINISHEEAEAMVASIRQHSELVHIICHHASHAAFHSMHVCRIHVLTPLSLSTPLSGATALCSSDVVSVSDIQEQPGEAVCPYTSRGRPLPY